MSPAGEAGRMIAPLGFRGEIHPCTGSAFEPTPYPNARQEDDGFDIRSALLGERLLRLQQTDQLLRFPVRQQERTVDKEFLAVDLSAPSVRVARDHTTPALDLDQVHLVERYDEQIDFVDAAVLGDELEVRPGAKRLAVGETGLDVVEGLALPGVFGGGDFGPAGRFHCCVVTWSGWTMASSLPEPGCRHSIVSARAVHHPNERALRRPRSPQWVATDRCGNTRVIRVLPLRLDALICRLQSAFWRHMMFLTNRFLSCRLTGRLPNCYLYLT